MADDDPAVQLQCENADAEEATIILKRPRSLLPGVAGMGSLCSGGEGDGNLSLENLDIDAEAELVINNP